MGYDEVGAEEAVDLILTLPRGSLWRSSRAEFGEMADEDARAADVIDEIRKFMQLFATGTTEGAQLVARPEHMRARRAARERAGLVGRTIEETEWEEV